MIALYNIQLTLSGKNYEDIQEQLKEILIKSEIDEDSGIEIETNVSSYSDLISIDEEYVTDMCDKCGYPIMDKDDYYVERGSTTHKDCSKRRIN